MGNSRKNSFKAKSEMSKSERLLHTDSNVSQLQPHPKSGKLGQQETEDRTTAEYLHWHVISNFDKFL